MNRSKKLILIIAVIIIAVAIVISCIIMIKFLIRDIVEQNNTIEYSIVGNSNESNYKNLEDIPLYFDFTDMVEDGCYIVTNSNAIYNIEKLDKFLENVKNNKEDLIRTVTYTIEGEPIIVDLEYTKDKFIYKIDSRRDFCSSEEDRTIKIKQYNTNEYKLEKDTTGNKVTSIKTYYDINLKSIKSNETIFICSYAIINKISEEKFEIIFNKDINNTLTKVLDKSENENYDYNVYTYKGTADVIIDNEKYNLRQALLNKKISIDDILNKAKSDADEDNIIIAEMYKDGGSTRYIYNNYQILKCNTIDGSKDLYIGVPSMYIGDVVKITNKEVF